MWQIFKSFDVDFRQFLNGNEPQETMYHKRGIINDTK
jgi:hypothetical protein